ncbi:MAG: hypothetical protein HKN23_02490, partial [Verrucomicrobiales bacterium]|nr:hypothetical protein [Verrucomicrobiales bacterium]
MRTWILPLVLSAAVSISTAFSQQESNAAREFQRVDEIIENWSADQHLWVKGSLRMSAKNLADLEGWLDENAPNWTVVLMENAQGQRYQNRSGMSAVEFAIGQQLPNQTAFGSLVDDRTKQKNGAIFVLFLQERKFSYFSSEAMDSRRLGHRRFVGELDKPAIRAMRNGGRIVDAVKDTISNIETQLTRRIESEEVARKRAVIERQRAIEEANLLAGEVENEVNRTEGFVSNFREEHPDLVGDLITPDLASWRANVKAIASFAEAEDVENARQLADRTLSEIRRFRDKLESWEADAESFETMAQRIAAVPRVEELIDVEGLLANAAGALESARENYARGDSIYRDQLEQAASFVVRAESEIGAWRQAVEAERRRKAAVQRGIIIASATAALLFLIGLIVANRLRRPAKADAEKSFSIWRKKLRGKFDALFALMDRAGMLIGPASGLGSRGFSGTTESLCREAIHEVDELFIMSSATDQVMDRVENLIEPRDVPGKFVNAFSSRRYRSAIELLGSKPIGFDDRETGLREIIEPTERSLLGEVEDYKPFRMSFERLNEIYDEKQGNARATIERLGAGIDGLPLRLEDLTRALHELLIRRTSLAEAATSDGFFPLHSLAGKLFPAAESYLNEAAELGKTDPVTALEGPIDLASRQLDEGERLVISAETMRQVHFSAVENAAQILEGHGRRIRWIDEAFAELTGRADQLGTLAVDRSIEAELDEFEDDLLRLRGRVSSAAKLSAQAEGEISEAIAAAEASIEATRKELASLFKLDGADMLTEEHLSPDERLEEARIERAAAQSALDQGNVTATSEDFSDIEKLLEEIRGLLDLSREVAKTHAERHGELSDFVAQNTRQSGEMEELLEDLKTNYDSAVLRFSTRIGEPVKGQDSIRDSVSRARERLELAAGALAESDEGFKNGHLIAAGTLLERAGNEIGFAAHQLALVQDQYAALKDCEADNGGYFEASRDRHKQLEARVVDFRTMSGSRNHYGEIEARRDDLEGEFQKPLP